MSLRSIVTNIGKKHHSVMVISRKLLFLYGRSRYMYYYLTNKVDNHKIIFETYKGRQYGCSPKAIYEELLKQNKDYTYIWVFKNPDEHHDLLKNPNTSIVKYGSSAFYKAFASSKYWFVNSRASHILKVKPSQRYIQCWHGTPLKKLGCDIEKTQGNAMNSIDDIHRDYMNDSKRFSYMISPSRYASDCFMSSFHITNKNIMIETGYPRNDELFFYSEDDHKRIKESLGIPLNKQVILYAPTFRDNQHDSRIGYTYELGMNFKALETQLENTVILFRAHYFVAEKINFEEYKGFVYNVSNYDSLNDLYSISDILITDYSSVFFDYANLLKPIYFYMYDYEEYKNDIRDFYLDMKELPGPISKNQEELVSQLLNKKHLEYQDIYKQFHNKFNYLDDGYASKRVIEKVIEE